MYCPKCGAMIKDDSDFCDRCGVRIEKTVKSVRLDPGYARNLDSEPVREALRKQTRTAAIVGGVLTVLPLIGFLIYGLASNPLNIGSAIVTGVFVSVVFGLTSLYVILKRKLARPFEGTVADKKKIRRARVSRRRGNYTRSRWRIVIDCEDGRRRKRDASASVFNYLQVGDRIRYLPQFPQPFEKYDKSQDTEIPCMFCGQMNPVESEICSSCRNPIVK